MGMYTQIRGWLNVDSIGDYKGERFSEISNRLSKAQEEFENNSDILLDRKWVCHSTIAHKGANGSAFLFIGTEFKNYDESFDKWIEFLLKYFPNAEGRIDYQYEEESSMDGDNSRYLLIGMGQIIKDDVCDTWCYGYGNMFNFS